MDMPQLPDCITLTRDKGLAIVTLDRGSYGGGMNPLSAEAMACLLYTSPSPRDLSTSRMPSSA